MFCDRKDAAQQLAEHLMRYKDKEGVVLAIPRGGVVTGSYLAGALGWSLSFVLAKKIGHPSNEEFAIGAVGLHEVYQEEENEVPRKKIVQKTEEIRHTMVQRYEAYSAVSSPPDLSGKTIIITDDGIATGHTVRLAIKEVRRQNPESIIVAVPVASPGTADKLEGEADTVFCLHEPEYFRAVSQFYEQFPQISDHEVVRWLQHYDREKLPLIK